jgi:hypothetical protein
LEGVRTVGSKIKRYSEKSHTEMSDLSKQNPTVYGGSIDPILNIWNQSTFESADLSEFRFAISIQGMGSYPSVAARFSRTSLEPLL